MLSLNQVTIRRGAKTLMSDVNLTIHPGQKVGIVGRNGTGKSSLFALIQGKLDADAGEMLLPGQTEIATVAQATPSGSQSAIDFVLDGDRELREVQRQLAAAEQAEDAVALAKLHDQMAAIDGYSAEARAARLLYGLGFMPETHQLAIDDFSGGWRMRLNLAATLMRRSDMLLLDEPTNHLDMDAVLWLQTYLARYAGTLLVISHDRGFLDAVAEQIVHIGDGTARLYTGNYSAFERQRAEQMAQQQAAFEAQQKRRAEMQRFVDRFRAKATKARQAQSRVKQLERMQIVDAAHFDTPFAFEFLEPERTPQHLLKLDEAAVGYDGQALVSQIKFSVAAGHRIAILGRNGAGKSTVMKLLAGELAALRGTVQPHRYLNIGYFAQHQLEQLDVAASPFTHIQRLDGQASEQELRDYLGGFDFRGDKAVEPIKGFSGGEKARLALACVVYQKPNLLLLDEPTNHLDLEMRHALERALQNYAGAVVLVAHDRHLIDAVCDQLWCVADGQLQPFDGNLDDYAHWLKQRAADKQGATGHLSKQGDAQSANTTQAKAQSQQVPASGKAQHQRRKAAQRALQKAERTMDKISQQIEQLDAKLTKPDVLNNPQKLAELSTQRDQLTQKLDAAESEWMAAAEDLEG